MQAVLLAAGQSSRFGNFLKSGHKSLISVAGKPLILHTLLGLKRANITNIIIVEDETKSVSQILGSGKEMGVTINYVTHAGARGMAAALLEAEHLLENEFFLLNPYHVNADMFISSLLGKKEHDEDIVLLAKKSDSAKSYGFLVFQEEEITGLIEKPEGESKESVRVVGIYLLNKKFVETIKQTPSRHYQLENAIDAYAKLSHVKAYTTDEETLSLKYPWDLLRVKNYVLTHISSFVSPLAKIAKSAVIEGNVYIDDNVTIMEGVVLKGSCYLGKNVYVGNNSLLRNGVCIEEGAVVGSFMEMKNTLMLEKSTTHTGLIEDSIIGKSAKIASGILTANVRLDRKNIISEVKGEKIDTGLTALGMIVGEGAVFGARITTMPGVSIGIDTKIGPSTTIMKNIGNAGTFYTKFAGVFEEKSNE